MILVLSAFPLTAKYLTQAVTEIKIAQNAFPIVIWSPSCLIWLAQFSSTAYSKDSVEWETRFWRTNGSLIILSIWFDVALHFIITVSTSFICNFYIPASVFCVASENLKMKMLKVRVPHFPEPLTAKTFLLGAQVMHAFWITWILFFHLHAFPKWEWRVSIQGPPTFDVLNHRPPTMYSFSSIE